MATEAGRGRDTMTPAAATQPTDTEDWPYSGARWWKFDFHTHTPASRDYGKGTARAAERDIAPRDWLLGFMRAGIDCVAVTDHNTGAWIDRLKQALAELEQDRCAGFRRMWLFPGAEITANGGTHILAIMDPAKSAADVSKLLGRVGLDGAEGAGDTTAKKSVIEVVEAVDSAGAVAIPAHADKERGLWGLSGNTLEALLRSNKLFAVEVVDTSDKPARYHELKVRWAEVLGSDSHRPFSAPAPGAIGRRFTWVKMAEPSLEGLRLALLDGDEHSVRRSRPSGSFEPPPLPGHHLQELQISDARLMGRGAPASVTFSPWLTAIVGGRGTGKSTIVHALRLVSRRSSELQGLDEHSSARRTFERFNRVPKRRRDDGGLDDGTELRLIAVRDGVRHRVSWSQNPQASHSGAEPRPTVEEQASDGWATSAVQDVAPERFPLRIFSQGQMGELADGNQQALLQIIDEAAAVADHRSRLEQAQAAFMQTRARIRSLDRQLKRRAGLQVEREDADRKLRRFEESGHADVLKTYRLRSRQRQEVERHFEVARKAVELIEEASGGLQPEDMDARAFEDDLSEAAVTAIASLAQALKTAAGELRATADNLRARIESEQADLAGSAWRARLEDAVSAHQQLVQTLSAEGINDPREHARLVQERSRIEAELADLESRAEARSSLVAQSEKQLATLFDSRWALSEARRTFVGEALEGNEFVRIELRAFGDSESLESTERSLRGALEAEDRFQSDILDREDGEHSGIVAELLNGLPSDFDDRRREFRERIERLRERFAEACFGRGGFGGHLNNFLRRRHEKAPEFLDRLLTWFPEDTLGVEYSRSGDGSGFAPIAQASAGQRAAAMLAFLLAHGDEPLVLDQPEDDLDNHLIYDLVVRQIRQNKLRRQIIAVTHNPNIVVNGDAEMVHALDFVGGQCRVVKSGSLQDIDIRNEVCRVMEGGREAFERRYRRIAPSISDV